MKPALHPSQFVCQDSTRACIEAMLQKDEDLEAARNELHAMRESSAAELAASEAAKCQLEFEVLHTAEIYHMFHMNGLGTR